MEQSPPLRRISLTPSVRFRILQRDDFTCRYCGRKAPNVVLEVDHLHPVSKGGVNAFANLVTACYACNQGKRDSLLTEEQVLRFTPEPPAVVVGRKVVPRQPARRRVPQVMIPVYGDGGDYIGRRPFAAFPISMDFVYISETLMIGQFICAACGFLNGLEDDQCSCRRESESRYHWRATPSRVRYCDCGEVLEEDDEEICSHCYASLYTYCWSCGEREQTDDSNYCPECEASLKAKA